MSQERHPSARRCNASNPDIWLTEQGVRYSSEGKQHPAGKHGNIATDIMHDYVEDGTNQLTRQSRQITRFFYYEMRGTPHGRIGRQNTLELSTLQP